MVAIMYQPHVCQGYIFGISAIIWPPLCQWSYSSPLFTKWTDFLLQDLVKSRNHEIHVYTISIALKFDRPLGSAAEMPVERYEYHNTQSGGFDTSRNLAIRGLEYKMQINHMNQRNKYNISTKKSTTKLYAYLMELLTNQ